MISTRALLLRGLAAALVLAPALGLTATGSRQAARAQDSDKGTAAPVVVISRTENAREAAADLEAVRSLVIERVGEEEAGEILLRLDLAIERVRRLKEPLRLAQLTEHEQSSLWREMEQERARAPKGLRPDDGLDAWQRRAMGKAIDGVDLDEEQTRAAEEILARWFRDAGAARMDGDTKRLSDLKRSRDKALREALGRSRSRKVIRNLSDLSGR